MKIYLEKANGMNEGLGLNDLIKGDIAGLEEDSYD